MYETLTGIQQEREAESLENRGSLYSKVLLQELLFRFTAHWAVHLCSWTDALVITLSSRLRARVNLHVSACMFVRD